MCNDFHCVCMCGPLLRPTEGIGSPGAVVTGGCELPGCWELHSSPLEEQEVLLTSEPSSGPYLVS